MKYIQVPPRIKEIPQIDISTAKAKVIREFITNNVFIRYSCRASNGKELVAMAQIYDDESLIKHVTSPAMCADILMSGYKARIAKERPRYRFAISRIKRR